MKAPLRVLYVAPHAELGGAERVTLDLLTLHDRALVEPSVCFLRDGPLLETCRALGVPTFLLVAPRLRRFMAARRTVRALADIARAGSADLVHSSMAWGHCYGGRAARRARCPSIWFQHDVPSGRRGLDLAAALIPARAVIANSDYTASLQQRLNLRRVPVHTIHPGTRLPREPWKVRRARGRAALGIADGEFAVGIAGRLQPTKGQHLVIRAAASLLHARADARLFIIGGALFGLDEDYARGLPELARTLGIADRVSFPGFRTDMADCFAALDLAVHASTTPEAFGLAVVEAMAAGTALIAADAPATREIVTPGRDGILVPSGDHESLATALIALHDDPRRRRMLAVAGTHTARTRFDVATMVRRVEDLYVSLVPR